MEESEHGISKADVRGTELFSFVVESYGRKNDRELMDMDVTCNDEAKRKDMN